MKKIITLVLTASMLFMITFSASAATQFSANGFVESILNVTGGGINIAKDARMDRNMLINYSLFNLMFKSGENVNGQVTFTTTSLWGMTSPNAPAGGALGTDGINLATRYAWFSFKVPGTNITTRIGLQNIGLPMSLPGILSPVMGDFNTQQAGITFNLPINDIFSLTGFWARPFDLNTSSSGKDFARDEFDLFALILPIKYQNYFRATPWAMFGVFGRDLVGKTSGSIINPEHRLDFHHGFFSGNKTPNSTTKTAIPFWFGVPVVINAFDPLTLAFDIAYGDNGLNKNAKRSGWYTAFSASYRLPSFTPRLTAWYTSGDGQDSSKGSSRMPYVYSKQRITGFGIGAGGIANSDISNAINNNLVGTWGISLEAGKISFIEKLEHILRVSYYQGTNNWKRDNKGDNPYTLGGGSRVYMTTKDSVLEFNFTNTYRIYDELSTTFGISYLLPNMSKSTWKDSAGNGYKTRNIVYLGWAFKYAF